jgi:hypothetical protein
MTSTLDATARKLVHASERHPVSAFARIEFPDALDERRPLFPLPLLSLYGHPLYDALPATTQWQLGLLETVNFFSMNIHGEQALISSMVERLYRGRSEGESETVSRYLQHFIHEENSHTYMLADFCNRYYGRVMPEIIFNFQVPALSRSGADLLFFARVYVLETFLDFVNCWAMNDDTLEPTARAVHRSHHVDEARHIAFGRAMVATLTARLREAGLAEEIRKIAALVTDYSDYAFSRLVNPRLYRELSLSEPLQLAQDLARSEYRTGIKRQWWVQPQSFFRKVGLLSSQLPDGVL